MQGFDGESVLAPRSNNKRSPRSRDTCECVNTHTQSGNASITSHSIVASRQHNAFISHLLCWLDGGAGDRLYRLYFSGHNQPTRAWLLLTKFSMKIHSIPFSRSHYYSSNYCFFLMLNSPVSPCSSIMQPSLNVNRNEPTTRQSLLILSQEMDARAVRPRLTKAPKKGSSIHDVHNFLLVCFPINVCMSNRLMDHRGMHNKLAKQVCTFS